MEKKAQTSPPAPESKSTSNICSVSRNLSELEINDKYSVIYEIARIETMIAKLAEKECSRPAPDSIRIASAAH